MLRTINQSGRSHLNRPAVRDVLDVLDSSLVCRRWDTDAPDQCDLFCGENPARRDLPQLFFFCSAHHADIRHGAGFGWEPAEQHQRVTLSVAALGLWNHSPYHRRLLKTDPEASGRGRAGRERRQRAAGLCLSRRASCCLQTTSCSARRPAQCSLSVSAGRHSVPRITSLPLGRWTRPCFQSGTRGRWQMYALLPTESKSGQIALEN